jgi:hypothetical protein
MKRKPHDIRAEAGALQLYILQELWQLGVDCGANDDMARKHMSKMLDRLDHNLIFGLLQLDHFAELVGLARLALANDFGRRFEHAEDRG